jgi:hypothetical protein
MLVVAAAREQLLLGRSTVYMFFVCECNGAVDKDREQFFSEMLRKVRISNV